jgi:hypothetical protein
MSDRQPMPDGLSSTVRGDAKRLGKGAITLLALGAPFVAAAPAAANGGGPEPPGDSQAESQASAHASMDGSGAGAGAHAASAAAAPQPSAEAPPPGGAVGTENAEAGASGRADVQAGTAEGGTVQQTGTGDSAHPTATETSVDTSDDGTAASADADAEVRAGEEGEAQTGGHADAEVSGDATARGNVNGRADAHAANRGTSSSDGSGAARPHARGDSRERASVHGAGEAEGEASVPVEAKVHGNGRAGGSMHARARVNDRRVSGGTEAGQGERGFTDVRVTPKAAGRVSAMVKASPALEAAIRAEAREAARAEIRARFARPEAATRFAVKHRLEGGARGVQRRRATADMRAEAFLRILETAWTTGGPARASALLELCLGRPASAVSSPAPREQALRESQGEGRRGHDAIGNAEAGGIGEIVGAARGERRESGEVVGAARGERRESGEVVREDTRGPEAPTPIVEAPSVPLTAPTTPGSGVMPGVLGAFQETDRPRQPRGSASQPGGTQLSGSAPGPGVTTGASAPSRVTREAGATSLQRQLPFTGAELPLTIIAGVTALVAGALLRRRVQGEAR